MSELVTKSVPQERQEQKTETRTGVARIAGFALIAIAVAVLAILGAVVRLGAKPKQRQVPAEVARLW